MSNKIRFRDKKRDYKKGFDARRILYFTAPNYTKLRIALDFLKRALSLVLCLV